MAVPYFVIACGNCVEDVGDIQPGGLQLLYVLDGVEELFHGVVENAEIGAAADHVFFYDFALIVEFAAAFVEVVQKVAVFVVFGILGLAAYKMAYMAASHSLASRLSLSQRIVYCICL